MSGASAIFTPVSAMHFYWSAAAVQGFTLIWLNLLRHTREMPAWKSYRFYLHIGVFGWKVTFHILYMILKWICIYRLSMHMHVSILADKSCSQRSFELSWCHISCQNNELKWMSDKENVISRLKEIDGSEKWIF